VEAIITGGFNDLLAIAMAGSYHRRVPHHHHRDSSFQGGRER
jgi:hypothetical protein